MAGKQSKTPRKSGRRPSTSPRGDRQFVTALARGLEIFRAFTPANPELGTADLAKILDVPQPTVWRLCHTLVKLGYLRPSGIDRLRLGIPLISLGMAALAEQPIAELAKPYMQDLADRFKGAVSLGMRDGLDIIYIQRCQGAAIVLAGVRVGTRIPMSKSASGCAYLAALPQDERMQLLEQIKQRDGESNPKFDGQVAAAVKEYESLGYITSKGALHPDINAVAVPVRLAQTSEVFALSCGGIITTFTDTVLKEIGPLIAALARSLAVAASG